MRSPLPLTREDKRLANYSSNEQGDEYRSPAEANLQKLPNVVI
jgi:hypothetical protein